MIEVDVPGDKRLRLNHLVLDYNGTLAVDGRLIQGVGTALNQLSASIAVHVITADTFGMAERALEGVSCRVSILPKARQAEAKLAYVEGLGAAQTVSMGNGRNDRLMLQSSALGVAVMLEEGIAVETLMAADIVVGGILPALSLLSNPLRMVATLRS